ncbi:MAG: hypothetical protein PHF56_25085 [Desulfuromonadaceae bacterium]|nr:hypothetical protein [Desulfuromonadaceae bacterium]
MIKKLAIIVTAMSMLSTTSVLAQETVTSYNCDFSPSCEVAPGIYGAMASTVMSKFNLSIGGNVRLDYAHNTNAVGPLSPAAPGGALTPGTKDESILTAKASRFWLKVDGPAFLGAKTNSVIEMDFYGGGSSANEFGNLRMRHAYGSLNWSNTQLLFGQYWDVFGPAFADTIDQRQGAATGTPNNPRVPQIRVTQKIALTPNNSLKIIVAAQNPVQDAASTGAGSMSRYLGADGKGAYGSMVNIAGQAVFNSKVLGVSPGFMGLGMNPLQLGLFGMTGSMKLVGNNDVDNYGYGIYGFVPILKSQDGKNRAMTLSLEGQVYRASGLDVQGATNGAPLNSVAPANSGLLGVFPDKTGARAIGYYGQLKCYVTQNLGLTAGHLARKAENYSAYPSNFNKKNQLSYVNATYDINAAIRVGSEYEHMESTYGNLKAGTNGYAQNNTFRMVAYYFF